CRSPTCDSSSSTAAGSASSAMTVRSRSRRESMGHGRPWPTPMSPGSRSRGTALVSSAPTAHSGFVTACATLREHLLASHTTTEQVGQIATAAGVKTLVLSHFVPGGHPFLDDRVWYDAVRP